MSISKMMAQRFAIDLSSMALGMWETAYLLSKDQSESIKSGRQKLEWLRKSLNDFSQHPARSDSLRIHLNKGFHFEEFNSLLNKLDRSRNAKEVKEAIPEIEALIDKTQGYLNETTGARANFKRAF